MAIELVNGGSVTCVDNNYNITYNGTPVKRIYACDTANNVCTLVYCKNQLTVTYNYYGFDGVASYADNDVTTGCFCCGKCMMYNCVLAEKTFGDYTAYMCYTRDNNIRDCIFTYVTGSLAAPPVTTFTDNTPSCTGLTNGYCYCICTCNLFKTPTFCFVVQGDTYVDSTKTFNCTHNIDYTSDTKSITYYATNIKNPASYSFLGCSPANSSCSAVACVRAIRRCFDTGVQERYAIVCVCDTSDGTIKCYCCPIGTSAGSITITTDF
jgi:hypothetical protein